MTVTSIRLSKEIEVPLKQLSQKLDRSKNYLINQAVKEFVHRQSMEELRWLDTTQALESVKAGRLVEASEVSEWLESWGIGLPKSPPKVWEFGTPLMQLMILSDFGHLLSQRILMLPGELQPSYSMELRN
jgi:predicted transcriptional regulator